MSKAMPNIGSSHRTGDSSLRGDACPPGNPRCYDSGAIRVTAVRRQGFLVTAFGVLLLLLLPSIARSQETRQAANEDSESGTEQEDLGFRVIVHRDNPVEEMDAKTISRLFLKRIRRWDMGGSAVPVDQPPQSEVRKAFSASVHDGRSIAAITAYWQRMIFSGRAAPPDMLGSDDAVLAFVEREPGAIGYVSSATEVGDGVKEIRVTGIKK